MLDNQTYRDLAVIVNAAKKKIASFSPRRVKAFFVLVKDVAAFLAAAITSGVDPENWDRDERLQPFYQRADESVENFCLISSEEANALKEGKVIP